MLCYSILVVVLVVGLSLYVPICVGPFSLVSTFSVTVSPDIVVFITAVVSFSVLIVTVDVHGSPRDKLLCS